MLLSLSFFTIVMWLGLHLIARSPQRPAQIITGLALVAYSIGLGLDSLTLLAPSPSAVLLLHRLRWPLLFLPGILWFAASASLRSTGWRNGWVGLAAGPGLYAISFTTSFQIGSPLYLSLGLMTSLLLLAAVALVGWSVRHSQRWRNLLLIFSFCLLLNVALLLFPLNILSRESSLLLLGLNLFVLGLCIAALDGVNRLWLDLLRSLAQAALVTVLLAGQVLLWFGTVLNFPLLALTYGLVTAGLGLVTFSGAIQAGIEKMIQRHLGQP